MKTKNLLSGIGNIEDKFIEEAAPQNQHRKRPIFYSVTALATTAAVICFVVFGNMFLKQPTDSNIFSVRAYAMEQQSDGSAELREVDLVDMTNAPGGYLDGKYLYLNVGLKCEGENIKKVDFRTEDGFFAKQYIKRENGKIITENVPAIYVGENNTLAVYGNDFEKVGSVLTLDKDMMADDMLLFVGKENVNIHDVSAARKITIYATATFNDGRTQEKIIKLDYSNVEAVIVARFTAEDMERWNKENAGETAQYGNEDTAGAGRVPGRGVIGIAMRDGSPRGGVIVMEVVPDSGAERAGIQLYDVVLRCNGKDIKSVAELNAMCNNFKPGETITLGIDRDGIEMDIDVTLQ